MVASDKVCALKASLTVGSYGDEGGGGEEEHEDHVTPEEEPAQRAQVVEPGGRVRVQGFVEERLEVGLTAERSDRPQTFQRDDEVGEDRAASCRTKTRTREEIKIKLHQHKNMKINEAKRIKIKLHRDKNKERK